jgi:hypothetical protein
MPGVPLCFQAAKPTGEGWHVTTDQDLRVNHEFVAAFETLRKRHGHREMHDAALRDVADSTGVKFETMRVARHLRNALAHDDPVNRDTLLRHHQILTEALGPRMAEPRMDACPRPSNARAYRVHAWRDERLEREMIANGFVSVGGAEIGDLTGVEDFGLIRSWLTEALPQKGPGAIGLFVGYWRRFLNAAPGDLVVLPTRTREVALGEFVGPYHFVTNVEPRASHRRAVSWNAVDVKREVFGTDLLVTLNGQHTVQDFKAPDAVRRLRAISESGIDPGPSERDDKG